MSGAAPLDAASAAPVRVFISYAHDSSAHADHVREFWIFLRKNGIDARLDVSAAERRQDWPLWMLREVRAARFVLVVASPAYKQRSEGDAPLGEGRGVQWEAALIREEVYADPTAALNRIMPVVLPGYDAVDIPVWLSRTTATNYKVSEYTVAGADRLLRLLTGQPLEIEASLGRPPVLPPRGPQQPAHLARAEKPYDVFLSHSHVDGDWVERLAGRLEDDHGFRVWLDRWILEPGRAWVPMLERGLRSARTIAVCLGSATPNGWFEQEIHSALDLQTKEKDLRVLPIMLPSAPADAHNTLSMSFLGLRMWADLRDSKDRGYAYHVLCQGIRGQPIGRYDQRRPTGSQADLESKVLRAIRLIQQLKEAGLNETIEMEYQRKLLDPLIANVMKEGDESISEL